MTRSTTALTAFISLSLTVAITACGHGAGEPAEPAAPSAAPAAPVPEAPAPPAPSAAEPAAAVETPPAVSAAPAPSAAPEPAASAAPGKPGKGKPAPTGGHAAEAAPTPVASASASPAGDAPPADACTTKNFHYSQLGAACHSGGRKAAKEVMKGVVKKAKAAGTDLKCTSCHVDMNSFQLKGNAVSDLKQWL